MIVLYLKMANIWVYQNNKAIFYS